MATKFTPAPAVKELAEELIKQYHQHLIGFRIEYVFSDTTPVKGGKEVWGTMRKISNLNAFLASPDDQENGNDISPFFCMTISQPAWETLDGPRRKALVDHELCHAGTEEQEDGSYKLVIIPHDLEEFTAIVQRHGLWRNDLYNFMEKAKTAEAPEEDEDE